VFKLTADLLEKGGLAGLTGEYVALGSSTCATPDEERVFKESIRVKG
jgi:hypothetical protein